jgi:hypothetical protein
MLRRIAMVSSWAGVCAVVMLSAFSLAGCGSPPSNTAGPNSSAAPAGETAATAETGGFPDDIPVYTGLVKDYVNVTGPMLVLNGNTADTVDQVRAFYRDRLPALGWAETTDPARTLNDPSVMAFDKGSAKLDVRVSTDSGQTRVSLQVEGYTR